MEERTYLSGTSLAGMSPTRSRVENDYYATPFEATEAILSREELHGSILEPAAGEGHISKVLREHYPNSQIISTDLVQREMIGSDVVLLAGWISSLRTIPKNSTTSSRTLRSLWRKSSLRKLWRYPLAR